LKESVNEDAAKTETVPLSGVPDGEAEGVPAALPHAVRKAAATTITKHIRERIIPPSAAG
jgi:hypothetical protein